MNGLTENHIDFIHLDLKARGITLDILIDELVDHICCMIEPEIEKGVSFQPAYNKLINSLETNTLKNIQHQTLLSTNLNYQNMKKSMFSLGVIGTLLMVAGVIFKINHIVPGGIILFLGVIFIILGFLPLFFYTTYKEQTEKQNVLLSVVGYLTLSTIILGVLFRVMHWPGAHIAILIGQVLLVVGFLPLYLISVFRKAKETKINLIYIIIIIGIGLSTMFMASSVRISMNVIDKYDSINRTAVKVTGLFAAKNDSLINQFSKKENYDLHKPKIEQIKRLSTDLDKLINVMKLDMVKLANNENANLDKFASKDDKDVFKKVMLKDGQAFQLKTSFANYRNHLLLESKDEYQKQLINSYLDFNLFTGNIYEQNFLDIPLIEGLSVLSGIQKNIKIAEFEILKLLE